MRKWIQNRRKKSCEPDSKQITSLEFKFETDMKTDVEIYETHLK